MEFRYVDILKYEFKANLLDAVRMFWQSKVLSRAFILLRPFAGAYIWLRNNTSYLVAFKQLFIWKKYEYPINAIYNYDFSLATIGENLVFTSNSLATMN